MIEKAIKKINPNADFTINANDINQIIWLNETTPIPKKEIEKKLKEVQAEYDAEQWKRDRQAEYPSIQDCIHALLDGGATLKNLQAKRKKIKEKFPK
jgi:MarR-like DNA-binding transcriptional regulator SgrR of sgrS sRNA